MSKKLDKVNNEFGLYERKGEPMCSSRQIAETFGKRHDHVLRDIQSIKNRCKEGQNLNPQFWGANYVESFYKSRGKKYPEFFLTRDGFVFLVMGYTGGNADELKVAYIKRFNQMESFIKHLNKAKLEHPDFTKAIEEAHEDPQFYHYSNEADMINRIVLGMSAKAFRSEMGLEKGESIRPFLSQGQIALVEELQRADTTLLALEIPFEDRKAKLIRLAQKRILKNQKAITAGE